MRHTALLVKLYFSGRRVVGSSGRRVVGSSGFLVVVSSVYGNGNGSGGQGLG